MELEGRPRLLRTTSDDLRSHLRTLRRLNVVVAGLVIVALAGLASLLWRTLSHTTTHLETVRTEVIDPSDELDELRNELHAMKTRTVETMLAATGAGSGGEAALDDWRAAIADVRADLAIAAGALGEHHTRRIADAVDDFEFGIGGVLEGQVAAGGDAAVALQRPRVVVAALERELDERVGRALADVAAREQGVARAQEDTAATDRRRAQILISLTALLLGAAGIVHRRESRRSLQSLVDLAQRDPVTGVFAPDIFMEQLTCGSGGANRALVQCVVDNIGRVNGIGGYHAGDQLLARIAAEIDARLEPSDGLTRSGVALIACIGRPSRDEIEQIAADLVELVRDMEFCVDGESIALTASVGVFHLSGELEGERFQRARAAVSDAWRVATERGGDQVVIAGADSSPRIDRMFEVDRLQQYFDQSLLTLAYQDIVAVDGARRCCELLLRIIDPVTGEVRGPGELIEAAELYGRITQLDRWVLDEAIRLIDTTFVGEYDQVSVNVSGRSIGKKDFISYVADRLRECPEHAAKLCFEITETAALGDLDNAASFMSTVVDGGASLALDDFGTGATSFLKLSTFPIKRLKIDGQFIAGCLTRPVDQAIVLACVDIARSSGVQTVAEAVETAEQLQFLTNAGVDCVQGWYLHRPERVDRAERQWQDPESIVATRLPC